MKLPGDCAILYRTNAQSRVLEEAPDASPACPTAIVRRPCASTTARRSRTCWPTCALFVNPNDDIAPAPHHQRAAPRHRRRNRGDPGRGVAAGHGRVHATARPWRPRRSRALAPRACAARCRSLRTLMGDLIAAQGDDGRLRVRWTAPLRRDRATSPSYEQGSTDEAQQRMENIEEFAAAPSANTRARPRRPPWRTTWRRSALVTDVDGLDGKQRRRDADDHAQPPRGWSSRPCSSWAWRTGSSPDRRSFTDENRLEEERRLCYVAITRAKDQLFLTYAQKRMLYGTPQVQPPLALPRVELPQELVHTIDQTRRAPARDQAPRARRGLVLARAGVRPAVSARAGAGRAGPRRGSLQAGDAARARASSAAARCIADQGDHRAGRLRRPRASRSWTSSSRRMEKIQRRWRPISCDRESETMEIENAGPGGPSSTETAYRYYVLDDPTISDREYDLLFDELLRLEEADRRAACRIQPHAARGRGAARGRSMPHRHLARLWSLDKVRRPPGPCATWADARGKAAPPGAQTEYSPWSTSSTG